MLRLFLNSCSVYAALLHMRNEGFSGVVAEDVYFFVLVGSSLSEFPGVLSSFRGLLSSCDVQGPL